jgi:DNA-binding MarR family transcriptional regulator
MDNKKIIYEKLFFLISGIHIKTRRLIEQKLKPLDMTFPQLGATMALSKKDNITQRELSDILDTDTTTIMVLCDSLEKKGLIKRVPDKNDRRINRIVLTKSGNDVLSKALNMIQPNYELLLNEISKDELQNIIPLLEKLYQKVKQLS